MEAFSKSEEFLQKAKARARATGYNPSLLTLAHDGVHKLTYQSPMGVRHFGRLGYGDFIYYKKYHPDIAEIKRHVFRTSHRAMTKLYGIGKFSANELAINILW